MSVREGGGEGVKGVCERGEVSGWRGMGEEMECVRSGES